MRTLLAWSVFVFSSVVANAQLLLDEPAQRIGAFQCLLCAEGGMLVGILPTHGRSRRDFEGFKELCVSDYRYIDGQLYVRFKLDDELWPDTGEWTVQASSWEAVCRKGR